MSSPAFSADFLHAITAQFAPDVPVEEICPLGAGLINDTYLVTLATIPVRRLVLQRINRAVFPDPLQVMQNLQTLSRHLQSGQSTSAALQIPECIPARTGRLFHRDTHGEYWRMARFLVHARTIRHIGNGATGMEIGRLIGQFHFATRDLPVCQFGVALAHYHDTPVYLQKLQQAIDAGAHAESLQVLAPEFEFVRGRSTSAGVLQQARDAGLLPLRITHGDPKLDNMLFDGDGHAAALIDLDTVQPGLIPHDVGDCLRSCCNRRGEDPENPEGVRFDLQISGAILRGYAAATSGMLVAGEIERMYDAIRLIPFELGVRFLTDHLQGDRYFRVSEHGQNLRKARIQFALVEEIERHERELRQQIREAFSLSPSPLISA